jgi:sucrose phosphorylase
MAELGRVKRILKRIYGDVKKSGKEGYFSQEDVVLITYGDSLLGEGQVPLVTLHDFANTYLSTINPELGSWEEVVAIGDDFQLMFDYVVNHFSSKGQWFENYLAGKEGYVDFAMEVDPSTDLSQVTRPRALPLLSEYKKHDGSTVHLWTTFSADQIDFNFRSLDVLEKMIEVLLLYAQKGATILRLDAIAYLWKEIGTTCIHLSETNVPHQENISYFGDGKDEAQMVYNFTLPPLLFYSFLKENGTVLTNWAKGLHLESASNTFFNFTASHDGIGVRPLEGILPPEEIDALAEVVKANGGQVSYKRNPDGSDSPYELSLHRQYNMCFRAYRPHIFTACSVHAIGWRG